MKEKTGCKSSLCAWGWERVGRECVSVMCGLGEPRVKGDVHDSTQWKELSQDTSFAPNQRTFSNTLLLMALDMQGAGCKGVSMAIS